MHSFLTILAALLGIAALHAAELPPPVTLTQARDNYAAAIAETKAANLESRAGLFAKYEAALERLQATLQSQSEIEKAIAVEKERDRFAKEKTIGDSKIPEIAALQGILQESATPFEKELQANLEQLRIRQIEILTHLSASLIALDATREAKDATQEIKRLEAAAASPPSITPPSSPSLPLSPAFDIDPPSRMIGKDNIRNGQEITKSASLKPDAYSFSKRLTIRKPDRESKERILLYAPPGTTFRESSLLAARGCTLYANGVYFKDSTLLADLAASLTARNSLFENCKFDKGGGWYSKMFNSKWRLENSVISGSFIPSIRSKSHGFEIRNCTFHRVTFEPFVYRDESDAGAEAVHRERTIDACKFVDCRIPLDLLICTTNCLFENCTFEDPKPLPVKIPVSATIYTAGSSPIYSSPDEKISLIVERSTELPAPAGSNLEYNINGTTLSFVHPPVAAP